VVAANPFDQLRCDTLFIGMRSVFADSLKNGRHSLSGFAKMGSMLIAGEGPRLRSAGAGLLIGQFPAATSRVDPNELPEGAVECRLTPKSASIATPLSGREAETPKLAVNDSGR
jgi:hypothetical protein